MIELCGNDKMCSWEKQKDRLGKISRVASQSKREDNGDNGDTEGLGNICRQLEVEVLSPFTSSTLPAASSQSDLPWVGEVSRGSAAVRIYHHEKQKDG